MILDVMVFPQLSLTKMMRVQMHSMSINKHVHVMSMQFKIRRPNAVVRVGHDLPTTTYAYYIPIRARV